MWQGWITFLTGVWLTVSALVTKFQTRENLIIAGIVVLLFGFSAGKYWAGIMIGMLGLWTLGSGLTTYLNLPINYLTTGFSIFIVSLICATYNARLKLLSKFDQ